MKKEKDMFFIILISLVFISYLFFFMPLNNYDRIDIIDSEDFRFRISEERTMPLTGYAYLSLETGLLSIDEIPDELTMHCYQRKSIVLKVTNYNEYSPTGLQLISEENENIVITLPDRVVIPPGTSKELTFFINSECPEQDVVKINQIISISGTDESFNIPISLYKRLE